MALTIRPLTVDDDLGSFGRIVLAAYLALPGHPREHGYDAELVDVAGRVGQSTVLGAFDGVTPVGCVTYVADQASPHAENLLDGEASFRMLAVCSAGQRRGIGEALVQRCVERARADRRAGVFIYSGDWMTAAHRLYGRLGFVRVTDRDWVLHDPPIRLLGFRFAL
ncbi:MAG TPA: GNAT family N-acetyltransferase [Candidatus Lustribacter sp.]|nr:GNAT family N-acetyltransferase [Candidatus Lustribacter sp.]